MHRQKFRDFLQEKSLICAPGIQDMIAAKIADKVGFDFIYASGYWTVASAYGLPDAGIATYSQMLDRISLLVKNSTAGVIADADTGFGGLINVRHTVEGYETAGVTAVQIEDQEFPKRCGHSDGKRVISTADMVAKIQVACAARKDPNFSIIARTDSRAYEGVQACIERGVAYRQAGADVVFIEGLETEAEMRMACTAVDAPMMANMADGSGKESFSAKDLQEYGFSLVIFPSTAPLAAAAAMESVLLNLKQTGSSESSPVPLFSFEEFGQMIGLEEALDFEKRWKTDQS